MTKTIIQASDLKEQLETLNLSKSDCTIISLDIQNMCPSVTFQMVYRAVSFFAQEVPEEEKERIATCLRLIQFGMGNTLLPLMAATIYCGAATDPSQSGLTIGGYESAWLVDLVASYLFIQTKDVFSHTSHYNGIYRDDGIAVLKGN